MLIEMLKSNVIKMVPSYQAQHNAVQKLVRPWEVEPLINRNPTPVQTLFNPPFPEQVARWLQGNFSAGQFAYQLDPGGFLDYWCAPNYTLRRGKGDCEDFSLLVVSMLVAGGVSADVAVGLSWNGYSWGGHAWVEGSDQYGFFLIEGTSGQIHRLVRPSNYHLHWRITPNVLRRAA